MTQNNNRRYYRAKAREWGLGETSKGDPQVAIGFDIITEDAEFNRITWFGFFTEKSLKFTVAALRNCGWEGDDLNNLEGLDRNEVDLVIEDEFGDDGNPRARVRWVNKPVGLSMKAPLGGDKAKAFAAAMKSQIRAIDAENGVKAKPKQAPKTTSKPPPSIGANDGPPPLSDDDIPF